MMRIETLKERIAKAEEKISKKRTTIARKTAMIEKKEGQKAKTADERERRWIELDIGNLTDDLERLSSEIKETEKTIENYRAQLAGEIERQNTLTLEIPEALKTLQTELVTEWDVYDQNRRERMRADYREMGYREFCYKYRGQDTKIRYMSDDEIHAGNIRDAESIILNLVNRVKGITGTITSWDGMTLQPDNNGWSILNGYVEGKEGRCHVESIGAGGYNIQRYHIRVLVKPVN